MPCFAWHSFGGAPLGCSSLTSETIFHSIKCNFYYMFMRSTSSMLYRALWIFILESEANLPVLLLLDLKGLVSVGSSALPPSGLVPSRRWLEQIEPSSSWRRSTMKRKRICIKWQRFYWKHQQPLLSSCARAPGTFRLSPIIARKVFRLAPERKRCQNLNSTNSGKYSTSSKSSCCS